MKTIPKFLKVTLLFFPFTFLLVQAFAQAPEKFNYQAVCRDNLGNIIANQPVTLRFNINDLAPGGASLYCETHAVTTNTFGLVNMEVGGGSYVSGNFSAIPWETGNKYLAIELNTGTGFNPVGTPQLLSVPYAIYANQSGTPGPQGVTGPTGVGLTGAQGPTGNDGIIGATGLQGPTGNDGAIGATGAQGPTGNDGLIGATGAQGPTGNDGAIGATGSQGPTGNIGATGPTGTFGVIGITGQTIYHNGTTWINTNNLFNTGTNIGIGTTTPGSDLQIKGNLNVPLSGTVTVAPANSMVNGVGTLFMTQIKEGDVIKISGEIFIVSSISSNLLLTLNSPHVAGAFNVTAYKDSDLFSVSKGDGVGMLVVDRQGDVGIGTTTPQGALDVSSTIGALIVPRMTTTQRNALTAVNGMIIYNTTSNMFNFYENGVWVTK